LFEHTYIHTYMPTQGLRSNLLRLYIATTEESFYKCQAQEKYQKLHFALAYFHSVLLERRKFGTLGLNIPYDFNDTDFEVCTYIPLFNTKWIFFWVIDEQLYTMCIDR
jgi:hypothetical protein